MLISSEELCVIMRFLLPVAALAGASRPGLPFWLISASASCILNCFGVLRMYSTPVMVCATGPSTLLLDSSRRLDAEYSALASKESGSQSHLRMLPLSRIFGR